MGQLMEQSWEQRPLLGSELALSYQYRLQHWFPLRPFASLILESRP